MSRWQRTIVSGVVRIPAHARLLRPAQPAQTIATHSAGHPRAWVALGPLLEQIYGPGGDGKAEPPAVGFDISSGTATKER